MRVEFSLRFRIKGSYYYDAYELFENHILTENQSLTIQPEPQNRFDRYALQIWLCHPPSKEDALQPLAGKGSVNALKSKPLIERLWSHPDRMPWNIQAKLHHLKFLFTNLSTGQQIPTKSSETPSALNPQPQNAWRFHYRLGPQKAWLLGYFPKSVSHLIHHLLYSPGNSAANSGVQSTASCHKIAEEISYLPLSSPPFRLSHHLILHHIHDGASGLKLYAHLCVNLPPLNAILFWYQLYRHLGKHSQRLDAIEIGWRLVRHLHVHTDKANTL